MKYWGFFLAKLAAAVLLIEAISIVIHRTAVYLGVRPDAFTRDLGYTSAMMCFFLFSVGLLYAVVWDQRYRCRTCLRRLRMPVFAGSWPNMMLFGQPRTEYICVYGHGTLKVPEEQISGPNTPAWEPHDEDIWKELEALEAGKR